jgi:hypothetical protein
MFNVIDSKLLVHFAQTPLLASAATIIALLEASSILSGISYFYESFPSSCYKTVSFLVKFIGKF